MARITKGRALAALATVAVLALAAGAYAYFTSTGSGTATATVGTTQPVILKATVAGTLYPGTAQPVTFTVDNPSSGAQRVGTISLTKVQADVGHPGCSTAIIGEKPDFTMTPVAVNKTYASGVNQPVTPPGSLVYNDTGINQDNCQGATLTLTLASN